ncbi:NAD(P)-binding protein [Meredithblackwellia eburnea MCA 4105]
MKAFLLEQHIKFDELSSRLMDTPEPTASAPEDIIVNVYSCAMNFFDILQVQGKHQSKPAFPYVAGAEFSGVIAPNSPIPKGCPWIPGKTRVFGSGQGAFGEVVKANWTNCHELPENMGFDEAAGLSVTYPTSYAALVNRANIQPGEFLLVHAAAGGVGLAALQIGKALGAIVIATGSASKLEVCKKAGADYVLDYNKEGWQNEVKKITKGHGADVVYDPVGMLLPSLKCIAWNGRAIVVGFAAGAIEKIPANLILLKNIAITGVFWGAYSINEPQAIPVVWDALLKLFAERKLRGAVFDKVYQGLDQVPEALRALGARETWGKVIVRVRNSESKL